MTYIAMDTRKTLLIAGVVRGGNTTAKTKKRLELYVVERLIPEYSNQCPQKPVERYELVIEPSVLSIIISH